MHALGRQGHRPALEAAMGLYVALDFHLKFAVFHLCHVLLRDDSWS